MSTRPRSPDTTPLVTRGSRVSVTSAAATGAIGAFLVENLTGTLFAVTTASAVGDERDAHVFEVGTGERIGTARQICLMKGADKQGKELRDASRLLGLVQVSVAVDLLAAENHARSVVDPTELLGNLVIHAEVDDEITGRVTGVRSAILVRNDRTQQLDRYGGLVEIIDADAAPFANERSGGGAVYTEGGELVGLVVGGVSGRTFVAPIWELLSETFSLADQEALGRHNQTIVAPYAAVTTGSTPSDPPLEELDEFALLIRRIPRYYPSLEQS